VLAYLHEHDSISNAQYRELLDVSAATAARDLRELVDHGLAERRGTTRDAYYTLPDEPAPSDATKGR
jgi:predicted HTH transcriptional regulator